MAINHIPDEPEGIISYDDVEFYFDVITAVYTDKISDNILHVDGSMETDPFRISLEFKDNVEAKEMLWTLTSKVGKTTVRHADSVVRVFH